MGGAHMTANDNSQPLYKRSGSENRQRGVPISIRLLPEERAALEERAQAAGLSLASFLRACGLGAPGPRAQRKPHVNAVELAKATAALNKAGSNLNQIAHILNASGSIAVTECFAALAEIRSALAAILEIVGRKSRL